jgi:hypothetical protein
MKIASSVWRTLKRFTVDVVSHFLSTNEGDEKKAPLLFVVEAGNTTSTEQLRELALTLRVLCVDRHLCQALLVVSDTFGFDFVESFYRGSNQLPFDGGFHMG